MTSTLGGIAIDAHARVLRKSGGTISGLYAAGWTTGGNSRTAPIGPWRLTKALVFGLLLQSIRPRRMRPNDTMPLRHWDMEGELLSDVD